MMDLGTIRAMADKAARAAARAKKVPYVPFNEAEVNALVNFPFPFLGTYVPKGWKLVEELFCDSSGFGAEDEPALTIRGTKEKMKERMAEEGTFGYAVLAAGQFQVTVGVFKKKV
jgi:hypothetical protein